MQHMSDWLFRILPALNICFMFLNVHSYDTYTNSMGTADDNNILVNAFVTDRRVDISRRFLLDS